MDNGWIDALDGPAQILVGLSGRTGAAELAGRITAVLGHPGHPALTDLPIGFWTSSWFLDIVGGSGSRAASRRLVCAGVLTAVPTIVTGLGDLPGLPPRKRRIAVLHAAANTLALAFYAESWRARGDERDHGRAVRLGWLGATVATAGGMLGGHLALATDSDPDATTPAIARRLQASAAMR